MATLLGRGQIQRLTGGTVANSVTGYVSPNLQSLRLTHSADKKTTKSQSGITTAAYYSDEMLELEIDFIPEGTTIVNAVKSAYEPAPGDAVTMSGLPVVNIGGFSDALNSALWIYEGSNLTGPNDANWTGGIKLVRHIGITSLTPIVA